MNEHLIKYRITPRILKANEEQTVTVTPLDSSCVFYDDLDYTVRVMAECDWAETPLAMEKTVRPVGGVLSFSFVPRGEQPFQVTVTREDSDKHMDSWQAQVWSGVRNRLLKPLVFCLYSLESDLYGTRPFKGDLHLHTVGSDGAESGPMVAAQYRKQGYDFIAVTDHYTMEPSVETAAYVKDVDPAFTVFHGEEVHIARGAEVHKPCYAMLHMVNFDPKESVNARMKQDPDGVEAEVAVIARDLDVAEEYKRDLAYYIWTCDAIRAAGGVSIFPHPYWKLSAGRLNLRAKVGEEILRRGLADVFELLGGVDKARMRMQGVAYEESVRTAGEKPVVGSSDAHTMLVPGASHFDEKYTVIYAREAAELRAALLAGRCVAVDNASEKNVYGPLRLVKYTWFLLENYFVPRRALCNAAGQALLRHAGGKAGQKDLISLLEREVADYDKEFFGY